MPSTVSATITIVANTGWWIATRVIHMALSRALQIGRDTRYAYLCPAIALQARGEPVLQVVEFGRDHVLRALQPGENFNQVRALVARAGRHRAALEAAADEQPDVGLRAVAAHRRDRQR